MTPRLAQTRAGADGDGDAERLRQRGHVHRLLEHEAEEARLRGAGGPTRRVEYPHVVNGVGSIAVSYRFVGDTHHVFIFEKPPAA